MKKALQQLTDILAKSETLLAGKKLTAGFDGFVDRIQRVIKEKKENKEISYFRLIKEFGYYITGKESSFSLEVETISDRIGGNMPIMANALGHMGMAVISSWDWICNNRSCSPMRWLPPM